ncbi:hypothetical protein [Shewanella sp. 8A]|nr:hypothetical protein [Shewanella sp. 8A]
MIDSTTVSDFIVSNVDNDFHKKKELKIFGLKLFDPIRYFWTSR